LDFPSQGANAPNSRDGHRQAGELFRRVDAADRHRLNVSAWERIAGARYPCGARPETCKLTAQLSCDAFDAAAVTFKKMRDRQDAQGRVFLAQRA
jgi:hypothetical protein